MPLASHCSHGEILCPFQMQVFEQTLYIPSSLPSPAPSQSTRSPGVLPEIPHSWQYFESFSLNTNKQFGNITPGLSNTSSSTLLRLRLKSSKAGLNQHSHLCLANPHSFQTLAFIPGFGAYVPCPLAFEMV